MIINAFKDKTFPFYDLNDYPPEKDTSEVSSDDDDELIDNKLDKEVSKIDTKLDHELIKKYFRKESLLNLFKYLKPYDDEIKSKNLDLMTYFV